MVDDFLGSGFCLVGRKSEDLELSAEAGAVFARLGGRSIALADLQIAEGEWDELFDSHPTAVVRPDRYIFGVVDEAWNLDRLLIELGRNMCLIG